MRRLALLLAVFAANAHAQNNLELRPPADWEGGWKTAGENRGPDWRFWMFLPAKAENGSLARSVSIVSIWGPKHGGGPHLINQWTDHLKKTCPEVSAVSSPVTRANGFTVGYERFYCPRRSDTGEGTVDFVKTIASDSGAYMVAVAQRTPPYASPKPGEIVFRAQADVDAMRRWLQVTEDYLQKTVRACSAQSQVPAIVVCSN